MPTEKTRISKLKINAFRGATKSVTLDFDSGKKSVLLYGRNGDGKSCFAEAIEWFFSDQIERLRTEGCSKDDYFSYADPTKNFEPYVKIEFKGAFSDTVCKSLHRDRRSDFAPDSPDLQAFLANATKSTFILRHDTMRDFVDETKTNKLKEVQTLVGLQPLGKARDEVLNALNKLILDPHFLDLTSELQRINEVYEEVLGAAELSLHTALEHANRLASIAEVDARIHSACSLKAAAEKAFEKSGETERGRMLEKIAQTKAALDSLTITISTLLSKLPVHIRQRTALSETKAAIEAVLVDLYRAAKKAIECRATEYGKCPLCLQPVDTGKLLADVGRRIEELDRVAQEWGALSKDALFIENALRTVVCQLAAFSDDRFRDVASLKKLAENQTHISGLCTSLADTLSSSRQSQALLLVPEGTLHALQELSDTVLSALASCKTEHEALLGDDVKKAYYKAVRDLRQLSIDVARVEDLTRQRFIFVRQIAALNVVLERVQAAANKSLKEVLKHISDTVADYYSSIHPDDQITAVGLKETDRRGVEFTIDFHGITMSPPRRTLSEAHLNTLGICLFLAASKAFNHHVGFLVFDDVVTSFDSDHRRSLAKLIEQQFSDYQILLTTHDQTWFEILRRELPENKWLFHTLYRWSFKEGVSINASSPSLRSDLEKCLAENDVDGAVAKMRRLIERTLRDICSDLGVKVEFKEGTKNENRSADELCGALSHYLNKHGSLSGGSSPSVIDYQRATIACTNLGVHCKKLEGQPLGRGDLAVSLGDLDAFVAFFTCPKCGKRPAKNFSPAMQRFFCKFSSVV